MFSTRYILETLQGQKPFADPTADNDTQQKLTQNRELQRNAQAAQNGAQRSTAPQEKAANPAAVAGPTFIDQDGEAKQADREELKARERVYGKDGDVDKIDATNANGGGGGAYAGAGDDEEGSPSGQEDKLEAHPNDALLHHNLKGPPLQRLPSLRAARAIVAGTYGARAGLVAA